ncbi:MAG: alpha-L-fucosidase [Candidatus Poribacteria bacterium]|nr:alpha-L-fucosidase [Candidatus Poribacteria bacterium]
MLPKPTPQQLAWQEAEMTVFFHFGVNTFTDREWGDGAEDPAIFNPTRLDCRQWVKTAKDAGFTYLILTAKHHDGFCLWQSAHTEHSVKNSPWKGGKGDVVREFAEACDEFGVKKAFYLSPWDRNAPMYGDSPAYNAYFKHQLTELLTQYGKVYEVWFDGACGEGPNGKRQEYDWSGYYGVVRQHQPEALIAICGPDVRWVGNEDGFARETEWSIQEPNADHHPGVTDPIWYPAECDVSIRPGWFWHPAEDSKVKTLDHLMRIYYQSVGRNSVLLLNVPPNDKGLLAEPDVARLAEFRRMIDASFGDEHDLARGATTDAAVIDGNPDTHWSPSNGATGGSFVLTFAAPITFNTTLAKEQIAESQRVEAYTVEAWVDSQWKSIVSGTTIGHKKIEPFDAVTTDRVRFTVNAARATPMIRRFALFNAPRGERKEE